MMNNKLTISAMYIIYNRIDGSVFSNPAESIMAMFLMSLGEFGDFYDSFSQTLFYEMAIVGYVTFTISTPGRRQSKMPRNVDQK